MLSLHRKTPIKSIFGIALMSTALGLTACITSVDPDVKARQDSMKSWGDAMGIMGDMAEAPDTFDAEIFKEQAAFLAEDAATPWSHFENQEAAGNATEAVWSNADGFRAPGARKILLSRTWYAKAAAFRVPSTFRALRAVFITNRNCLKNNTI